MTESKPSTTVDPNIFTAGMKGFTTSQRHGAMHAWGTQPELPVGDSNDGIRAQPKYTSPPHPTRSVSEDPLAGAQYNWLDALERKHIPAQIQAIGVTLAALSKPTSEAQETVLGEMATHKKQLLDWIAKIRGIQPACDGIDVYKGALRVQLETVLTGCDYTISLIKSQKKPKARAHFQRIGRERKGSSM
jgi:hypothetical protein